MPSESRVEGIDQVDGNGVKATEEKPNINGLFGWRGSGGE